MYTDPEEARSDLFLVGAVYLFGPLLLRFVSPIFRIPLVGDVLLIIAPLVTTALVPVLLVRYRKEPWSTYGLDADRGAGVRLGLLLALPFAAAVALVPLLGGGVLGSTLPALALGGASVVGLLENLADWIGLSVLAVYATVKARDAFRSDYRAVREAVLEVGRVLGIVGGVGALLALVVAQGSALLLIALPLAAAGAVVLLLRHLAAPSTTSRAALIAPVVLLALRPFNPFALLYSPEAFVLSTWLAAIVGSVGLLIAALMESRRNAWAPAALGLALGLFVPALAA